MSVLELFSLLLRGLREFSVNILFHNKSANGNTVCSSPSTVFYIHCHRYLRFVHWGKTHKYRVVVTTVLGSTRLATGLEVVMR